MAIIPYRSLGGRHRPYLGVVFYNSLKNKESNTFGLMDSGADNILIPYSIGIEIGFNAPTVSELKSPTISTGVGGDLWTIQRRCRIRIPEREAQRSVEFDEMVSWKYPFPGIQSKQNNLNESVERLKLDISGESDPIKRLSLSEEIKSMFVDLKSLTESLEGDTLLGRDFFCNFSEISFFQHSEREPESSFKYEINEEKVARILAL